MRLIPILALTILLAIPSRSNVTASQVPETPQAIKAALEKAEHFSSADLYFNTTRTLVALIPNHGQLEAPIICDIQMPKEMWWLVLIASECTGADPYFVATVLRFESDFRVGPIGHGTYVGPGGIHRMFSRKFPIHDLFGNICTVARRLAMFESKQAALAGYNKDRSPNYRKYCRAVLGWTKRIQRKQLQPRHNDAWYAAVKLGNKYLDMVEFRVATYRVR